MQRESDLKISGRWPIVQFNDNLIEPGEVEGRTFPRESSASHKLHTSSFETETNTHFDNSPLDKEVCVGGVREEGRFGRLLGVR